MNAARAGTTKLRSARSRWATAATSAPSSSGPASTSSAGGRALSARKVCATASSPSAGFATLALNGGYRFNDQVRLIAGIDNVFDRTYSEHLNLSGSADFGYPADPVRINEPGRTAWVKLQLAY